MKILIIDDDLDARDIFHIRLENAGFEVIEAVNGEQGYDIAVKGGVDLILLDVVMPKKDGWEICKTLKNNPKTKDIPIIVMTARAQPIDEMRSRESRADEYLAKPIEHAQLMESINKISKQTVQ